MPWAGASLRGKLIVACVLVQLAAAALLVFGSSRLLQRTLVEQAGFETRQIVALLDQAVAAPLAQRDYAAIQQLLDLVRSDASIHYLVLSDHRGRLVAASGWDTARPLPPRDSGEIDLERADATLHATAPIAVAGQALGRIDFGLSTARLRQARADFQRHSLLIGAAALAVSVLVLAAIAYAITRHLARLAKASKRVAEGDFDVQVPVTTSDEIGRLGISFNAMAAALKQRVQALEESRTQQRLHLNVARDEQSRLTTLLGAMHVGIMFVDGDGRVIYANASFARIWSLPGVAPGQPLAEIVPALARQADAASALHLEAMLHADATVGAGSRELHTQDGRIVLQRMQPVAQGGESCGRIWLHEDITLERQTQQRAHQALHDPLTGLLNRRGFHEALHGAIAQCAADAAPLALMFIDLDDFKNANDAGGHRTGDEILAAVARTLVGQTRKGEVVARLGGDEFAMLCPAVDAREAGPIAARLVEAVAGLRFKAAAQTLRVGCSIGIAAYPADARGEDELIGCADAAMYEAKQAGKNGWAAYRGDALRDRAEPARVDWSARLHRALQAERFVLHFQPVCRAADLRVAHHEALVRMLDEDDPARLISPAAFMPDGESSGMIRQLDRWVFAACIAQLAATPPALCIAANLSARSLEDAGFPGFLRDTLQRHDVDPRRLLIELTSTIGDPVVAHRLIDALRALGCAVHLDDFGSGFSSFAHLKLLNVDAIKIDGAFIRNLHSDPSNRLFVASMIEIAHSLNKVVVAEHVEDAATLETLRSLGIDLVQGYHLGRPAPGLAEARAGGHLQVVAGSRRTSGGDST